MQDYRLIIKERLQAIDREEKTSEGSRDTVVLDQQSVGRLSRMGALQQQAMAKATHQRRSQERAKLRAALSRLDDGSFGFCSDCGEAIDPRRLALSPTVILCMDCLRG